MTTQPAQPIHPDAVRRIVAEVLERIRSGAMPAAAPAPPVPAAPTLPERVLTLSLLERLPAGTRTVVMLPNAVITPSARDYARDAGIELVRGAGAAAQAAAARPFLIARADCPAEVAGRCAGIARALPHAQQLPATGLADVITAVAAHVSRDAARGILLTTRPAAAVVLANRSTALRAVTARDAATLATAAAECGANLLVVNPKDFSPSGLERICVEFARRDGGTVPTELAAAPKACACQGHAH